MPSEEEENTDHKENIARLLALSDGVFAVAITLLVLDIRLPAPPLSETGTTDHR